MFKLENQGNDTLEIKKVKPSCGCTVAILSNNTILPGNTGEVHHICRKIFFPTFNQANWHGVSLLCFRIAWDNTHLQSDSFILMVLQDVEHYRGKRDKIYDTECFKNDIGSYQYWRHHKQGTTHDPKRPCKRKIFRRTSLPDF